MFQIVTRQTSNHEVVIDLAIKMPASAMLLPHLTPAGRS